MRKRRVVFLTFTLAFLLSIAVLAKRVFDMTAPPVAPKPDDFVFPQDDGNRMVLATAPAPVSLPFSQHGGYSNDASHLNRTSIYGTVRVRNEGDVREVIQFAKANKLKIACAGEQHSMGGQSIAPNGIVLDMRGLNHISIDKSSMTMTVGSGARWWEIQQKLDAQGFAVKSMQSINLFSVGGTLSVNAHGIDPNPGPIATTVRSVRVMTSDGTIVKATPTEHAELFRHVLGGYGLFGVILDAVITIVPNEAYIRETSLIDYRDFTAKYNALVESDSSVKLAFSRLSVSPRRYLREVVFHRYVATTLSDLPPLEPARHNNLSRFVINLSKTGAAGRWVRWNLEKYAEPHLHSCTRNQAMNGKEACVVSRNGEMYDDMPYLRNRLKDTDILQEYFVPYNEMAGFVDALRETVTRNDANLLNVTIRTVHKDEVSALPYAKTDMFAFVLYFNVGFNASDNEKLKRTTSDLIDAAAEHRGTFYLPYQLYYTAEQLRRAYPEIDGFFSAKTKFDPDALFTNRFYEKYSKPLLSHG